jgi:hypothetical protein
MARITTLMLAGSLLLLSGRLDGQTKEDGLNGTKIVFHVTAVSQKEDPIVCDTGECSAMKFTIEGYAGGEQAGYQIEYVLTCDEYLAYKPTPHLSTSCSRLHANNSYLARLYDDSISFWPDIKDAGKDSQSPMRILYRIVSEKEVSKQGK